MPRRSRRTWLILAVLAAILVGGLILWFVLPLAYRTEWTGLGASRSPIKSPKALFDYYPSKTLWDWLQLLIVPVVLAGAALWFNATEKRRDQEIAQKNRDADQAIADERQQDAALDTYLATMTTLLLDKGLRESMEGDEVRAVAVAQTLTVLPRLNGTRKGVVLRFLYTSRLIDTNTSIVALGGADLHLAILSLIDLTGVNLTGVNLTRANLSEANLYTADLQRANLSEANLSEAVLVSADLTTANLGGATLHGAPMWYVTLVGADLARADLTGADLTRADLTNARHTTPDQLAQAASLEGAIMPDGQKHP